MRIIGGQDRGRRINPPKGLKARPTTDFAKESLFNILNNLYDFEGVRVLDLFAGTGSLSYEFASRGSKMIDTVEIDPLNFSFIKSTARSFDYKIHVIRNDAFKYLDFCKVKYDIIFADPPYTFDKIDQIVNSVFERNLLTENGILIIEHSGNNDFSNLDHFVEIRHYGGVNFSFFK